MHAQYCKYVGNSSKACNNHPVDNDHNLCTHFGLVGEATAAAGADTGVSADAVSGGVDNGDGESDMDAAAIASAAKYSSTT